MLPHDQFLKTHEIALRIAREATMEPPPIPYNAYRQKWFWLALVIGFPLFLLMSCGAKADGMNGTPVSTTLGLDRTCYVKAFVSGDYHANQMTMAAVTVDSLAASDLGFGGQVGCDIASQVWLAGVFADYSFRHGQFSATAPAGTLMSLPVGAEGAIGGRLGVLPTSRTLLYVLGAAVWSDAAGATMVGVPLNLSGPRGIGLGGGIEVAVTKSMTFTLEYRHVNFEQQTSKVLPVTVLDTENQVRGGLGLRF